MFVLIIKFDFSIQQLAQQRTKFKHKICYKGVRSFLALKSTPTVALASRVMQRGKFLKVYKLLNMFFVNRIIYNVKKLPYNNEFKGYFYYHQSFKDFNRILFWKITSVNSLFNLKKLKQKKLLYYLPTQRRHVLVLLWLKNLMKSNRGNDNNLRYNLYSPIQRFIFTNKESNLIHSLKIKIYKLRLVRG